MSSTQTHQLQVKGMSCQHCVKAVTKAIQHQDPEASVTVDLPQGQVVVQSTLTRDAVAQAIAEEGYEVQN
ncbi:heavy-metal-associated domain-containing protein [Aquabacterium sp.]|uniref:heavy-metal-associated domain-containing protein n=1 Tax=Aquabacterium sp. TaxID=1872578 RepID=UPI002E35F766|nr:cation transporter [Aquabacterium sp.]HEX5311728.1 cation transporter [Aquabacterium sp.]